VDERTPHGSVADVGADGGESARRGRHLPVGAIVLVAAALLLLVGISGWFIPGRDSGGEPSLSIDSAATTPAPAGESAALYFSVVNDGGPDDLVAVRTAVAERATLHQTEDRDGFVAMSETPRLPVPTGGTLVLRPGGSHVMLEDLVGPLVIGSRFEVTLEFERSGPRTVTAQVVTPSQVVELAGTAG
jgi:copper(I)-binding protein